MALIGTISGSVGAGNALVSATAISGTLVIADSPASVFPTLPTDVKFFVSGSTTGTGTNAVFGGRVVVSGTTEMKGDLTLSGSNVYIGSAVLNIGGTTTTSSFSGDIAVGGRTNISTVVEKMGTSNGGTGTVSFDLGVQGIFYVNNPTGNITANFTNVPTNTNRVITPTVILSQSVGASRPIVSAVQIDGSSQTIDWANGVTPTGNSGKQDVFGFSLIRSGSGGSAVWKVLGQMSTYG